MEPRIRHLRRKPEQRKLPFGPLAVYRRCVSHLLLADCEFTAPKELYPFLNATQCLETKGKCISLIDSSDSRACVETHSYAGMCFCLCVFM